MESLSSYEQLQNHIPNNNKKKKTVAGYYKAAFATRRGWYRDSSMTVENIVQGRYV